MRVSRKEFQRKPLRAHALLADVPLHDVWAMHLRGGGEGRSLEDFQELLWFESFQKVGRIVDGLVRLRWLLGRMFGWDDEKHRAPALSYVHRLTDEDRARSIDGPGSLSGLMGVPTRVVYAFDSEKLYEIVNFTSHTLLLMTMEPRPEGYMVYWAIYVKRVNWFTPMYMALIDPFRRLLVYPALIKRIERAWEERMAHSRVTAL